MKVYKIGAIGIGGFGRFCVENYQSMKEVEVVAVSARNKEAVENFAKEFSIPKAATDYKEIVNDPEIDIVAIMTPPDLHAEMAIECARAGKAFLVEKPLAISKEQAESIIKTADEYGVVATIGYVMRYTNIYVRVKEVAKSGKLGKLKRILFENYASGHLPDSHWLFDKNVSGGLLVEHGVHFFDIFTSVVGQVPTKAASYTPSPRETLAVVEYPGGVIATFYHAFDKPENLERNWGKFIFEKGYIEVNGWIPMSFKMEYENEWGEIIVEEEKISVSKDAYYRELVKDVMRDLVRKIESPEFRPRVSLEEGKTSLELALEARDNELFK